MNKLLLHSTKFDGSLHYRYPVQEVQRSADLLVTYAHPGVPVESHRGSWIGQKHILSFFWRARPYVLHVRWDNQWQPEFLYVDIATGTGWHETTVTYIDLDLDLILRHESTAIHLDDQDEFEDRKVRWNYPADLVNGCWSAVEHVRGLLSAAQMPFTSAMFTWRPGVPLDLR